MPAPAASVVLVHGLWLHGVAMFWLRRALQRAGFDCHCFSYPSVRRGLAANAAALAGCVREIDAPRVHLVGHSLGGLLILEMLQARRDSRIGRAVLLGSPCAGTRAGDTLLGHAVTRPLLGRSMADWLDPSRPPTLPPLEVGIVAGCRSIGLGRVIPGLPRPNDGVVGVSETRLPGAADHLVLPVAHSQMLFSPECARQTVAFLRRGSFDHDPPH